jgi:anthranilate 1,2-dioxygenase large subunit
MDTRVEEHPPEDWSRFRWPEEGTQRIPDWVYTSEQVYKREVERIFHGPTWNFVGLEVEIPKEGDYRRSYVGDTSVLTVRGKDGQIHVVQNRCSHRGTELCRARSGHVKVFTCPYHQWSFDLAGNLRGIPFRRGSLSKGGKDKGGMPDYFKPEDHGLRKLKVATRNGLIFASFSEGVEPLEQYLGKGVADEIDTVFAGREIKVLGYFRQRWLANWKLYQENIRDPNHAVLLHVFLATFGFNRPDNVNIRFVSDCGRHSTGFSRRGAQELNDTTRQMASFKAGLRLKDERILQYTKEDKGPWSVAVQSIWPGFVIQRQVNALAVREVVPNGPHEFYLHWTVIGFADDTEEMIKHRMRLANLTGPAGMIGVDDSEVLNYVRDGLRKSIPDAAVLELGGKARGTTDTVISESAIRSLYDHYRKVMEL